MEIEFALKLKRDSCAPMVARAADTVSIAVSRVVNAAVAVACVETLSALMPSELALRLERLKYGSDDVRTGCLCGLVHQRFNPFEVIQYRRVAARVLNE